MCSQDSKSTRRGSKYLLKSFEDKGQVHHKVPLRDPHQNIWKSSPCYLNSPVETIRQPHSWWFGCGSEFLPGLLGIWGTQPATWLQREPENPAQSDEACWSLVPFLACRKACGSARINSEGDPATRPRHPWRGKESLSERH